MYISKADRYNKASSMAGCLCCMYYNVIHGARERRSAGLTLYYYVLLVCGIVLCCWGVCVGCVVVCGVFAGVLVVVCCG